jgi:riboflavin kinase/FMN adenylyltransferase
MGGSTIRKPAAATIGVFDGVHRGHQELLKRVAAAAEALDGVAVAVTFARHPLAVLNPERCPPPLTTVEERRALFEAHGIREVIVLDFDLAMSRLGAREFLESALLARHDLRVLVVGPDFAMGRNRSGDLAALRALGAELGFALEVVEPVGGVGGRLSSTRLRTAIAAGQVEVVRELTGRDYLLAGEVVAGHGRGRALGFPTANVKVDERKLVPADGVYVALAAVVPPGESGVGAPAGQPAVVNIGLAPTFGEGERRIEVHLLDTEADLRGRRLAIRLVARLRGERRFAGADELREQIAADIAAARAVLGGRPAARSAAG